MRAGPKERWQLKDRVALSIIGLVSSLVVMVVGFLLVGRPPQMGAVRDVSALPAVNAWLNATSAALLTAGYGFIRRSPSGATGGFGGSITRSSSRTSSSPP